MAESADLAHVGEFLGEDPTGLGHQVVRGGRREFDVGDHAMHGHRVTDDLRDAGLDAGLASLRLVLEEGLLLGKAQRDDGAIDGDRAARDDQGPGRWMRAEALDDGRPRRQEFGRASCRERVYSNV